MPRQLNTEARPLVHSATRLVYRGGVSKGVKILLVVLGLCVLGLVGIGVAGYVWFDRNKEELKASVEAVQAEAKAYAARADQEGCMAEGRRRADECGALDLGCGIRASTFLRFCLDDAAPSEGFCEGVPAKGEIMDGSRWILAQCSDRGGDSDRCRRLQQVRQDFCQDRGR